MRRKAVHALKIIERVGEESAEVIDSSLVHDIERVGGWKKSADVPLGEIVARAGEAREGRRERNACVKAEIARQIADPDYSGSVVFGWPPLAEKPD